MTDKIALKAIQPGFTQLTRSFTQREIERAVRGARKGGFELGRVEISPTGSIILWSVEEAALQVDNLERELRDWRRKRGTH